MNCSIFLTNLKIETHQGRTRKRSGNHCGLCSGVKCECVSDGWLSKTTPGRINATQICIEQGYSGDILEIGNNGGYQCNTPIDVGRTSLQAKDINNFESPVSWQCATGATDF